VTEQFQVGDRGRRACRHALAVELGHVASRRGDRTRRSRATGEGQGSPTAPSSHFYFWNCWSRSDQPTCCPPATPSVALTPRRTSWSDYWFPSNQARDNLGLLLQRNDRLPQYLTEEVLRARIGELAERHGLYGTWRWR